MLILTHQDQIALKNIVGKGEIARNEQLLVMSNFSFSHNVFYSIRYLYLHLSTYLIPYIFFAVELEESKIGPSGNGIKPYDDMSALTTSFQRNSLPLHLQETLNIQSYCNKK